jgi:hypothetical protein
MGNSSDETYSYCRAENGAFTRTCVETEGLVLSPQVGREPTTLRLTDEPLVAAARRKRKYLHMRKADLREIGGLGGPLPAPPPTCHAF